MGKWKAAAAKVTPELEAELRDRLEELLDQRDDAAAKRSSIGKLLGGHVRVIEESIVRVRHQLKGQDLDQLEIPGTQIPEPAQDPLVVDLLRLAGGIVKHAPAPKDQVKGALPWRETGPDSRFAAAPGGSYQLQRGLNGGWTAEFESTSDGRKKTLAMNVDETQAKAACEQHHLDRTGDQILKAAGDDKMTRSDLKGPAERFKKRKR